MRSIVAGCFAGLVYFAAGGTALAAPPEWQISEASGKVTVARAGLVKAALRGGALRPGDVIRTGPKSRAVLIRGGEYLVVSPASEIQIAQPEASGGLMQIIENVGSVLFRIEKKTTPHFGVRTPYMAAVVKGTIFTVTVDREGTSLKVSEGAVEVATLDDGAREMIRPGMVGRIFANDTGALRVFDGQERVIRSARDASEPGEAPAVGAPTSSPEQEDEAEVPATDVATINAPIGEAPVNLAMITGGMITGDSSYAAAIAMQARTEMSLAPVTEAPAMSPTPEEPQAVPPAQTPPAPAPTETPVVVTQPAPPQVEPPVATPDPAPPVNEPPVVAPDPSPPVNEPPIVVVDPMPPVSEPPLVGDPAPAITEPPVVVTEPSPPVPETPIVVTNPVPPISEPPVDIKEPIATTPPPASVPGNGNGNGNGNSGNPNPGNSGNPNPGNSGNPNPGNSGNGNSNSGGSSGGDTPGFDIALVDGNLVLTVNGSSYVFGKGKGKGGKSGGK